MYIPRLLTAATSLFAIADTNGSSEPSTSNELQSNSFMNALNPRDLTPPESCSSSCQILSVFSSVDLTVPTSLRPLCVPSDNSKSSPLDQITQCVTCSIQNSPPSTFTAQDVAEFRAVMGLLHDGCSTLGINVNVAPLLDLDGLGIKLNGDGSVADIEGENGGGDGKSSASKSTSAHWKFITFSIPIAMLSSSLLV